jgi:hypothetical protein
VPTTDVDAGDCIRVSFDDVPAALSASIFSAHRSVDRLVAIGVGIPF